MKGQHPRNLTAGLNEAAVLQDECAEQRLALEWGQFMFTQLVQQWNSLQAAEFLAYEDKVTAQVRMLEAVTTTLWHLHRTLAHTRCLLKHHQRALRCQMGTTNEGLGKDVHEKTLHRRPQSSSSVNEER
jgi:hypothetical protein